MLNIKYIPSGERPPREITLDKARSGAESILDLLDGTHMRLPYGCRAGSCGVCRVRVLNGLEALEERGFVEQDTLSNCKDPLDVRLACQARVKKDFQGQLLLEAAPEIL